jgi:dihydrofolate reductase
MRKDKEIAIIYARSPDRNIIGVGNSLPWAALAEDMNFFRKKTERGIVIMGRRTFESFDFKPLKNRVNVVVSRALISKIGGLKMYSRGSVAYYRASGCGCAARSPVYFFTSTDDVMTCIFSVNAPDNRATDEHEPDCGDFSDKSVFFIGGAGIFRAGYRYCGRIYETLVNRKIEAEKDFIAYNIHDEEGFDQNYVLAARRHYYDAARNISFDICSYERKAAE